MSEPEAELILPNLCMEENFQTHTTGIWSSQLDMKSHMHKKKTDSSTNSSKENPVLLGISFSSLLPAESFDCSNPVKGLQIQSSQ